MIKKVATDNLLIRTITHSTARSISASSHTMTADLPPSSNMHGVRFKAAAAATCRPVATEPVNATFWTAGCLTSGVPAAGPRPATMFRTPGGKPAAFARSPRSRQVCDACSEGLSTAVQPGAKHQTLYCPRVNERSGKNHGNAKYCTFKLLNQEIQYF